MTQLFQQAHYFIELELGSSTFNSANFKVWLKDSDNKLGAKLFHLGDETITEIVIDKANQTVLFENRDYRPSAERHTRAFVKGNLNTATGAFSSISQAQFIQSEGTTVSGEHFAFGTNGTDAWYDYYLNGSQDNDYDICSGSDCSAFDITYNASFYDFSGNASSAYDNANILSLTFPLNMSF